MRIKEIREAKSIKQKDLAETLGIAPNTLSQYENEKREPDIETLKRIAAALGVSVDNLLGTEKAPAPEGGRESDIERAKIALFGGDGVVTDEMWDEAIFAAQLIKERHKRKKD